MPNLGKIGVWVEVRGRRRLYRAKLGQKRLESDIICASHEVVQVS
jgi:hypothetical protein